MEEDDGVKKYLDIIIKSILIFVLIMTFVLICLLIGVIISIYPVANEAFINATKSLTLLSNEVIFSSKNITININNIERSLLLLYNNITFEGLPNINQIAFDVHKISEKI